MHHKPARKTRSFDALSLIMHPPIFAPHPMPPLSLTELITARCTLSAQHAQHQAAVRAVLDSERAKRVEMEHECRRREDEARAAAKAAVDKAAAEVERAKFEALQVCAGLSLKQRVCVVFDHFETLVIFLVKVQGQSCDRFF